MCGVTECFSEALSLCHNKHLQENITALCTPMSWHYESVQQNVVTESVSPTLKINICA